MSIVAGRTIKGGYEIASDSITTRGWTQNKSDLGKFSKLTEINGIVIGAVGKCEEASLLLTSQLKRIIFIKKS